MSRLFRESYISSDERAVEARADLPNKAKRPGARAGGAERSQSAKEDRIGGNAPNEATGPGRSRNEPISPTGREVRRDDSLAGKRQTAPGADPGAVVEVMFKSMDQ
jgi:hypothetical protein